MNLEDQVTSLELSKKLCYLGVKQQSLFYWCVPKNEFKEAHKKYNNILLYMFEAEDYTPVIDIENNLYVGGCGCCQEHKEAKEKYSAFTVAELGEMLPFNIILPNEYGPYYLEMKKYDYGFFLIYKMSTTDYDYKYFWESEQKDNREANARAKMLIHLIENNLIEVPK